MTSPKIPPHSEEAEKSVLGALLIDKDAVTEVAEVLRPEMFYNTSNGLIFEAMADLYENRDPIDVLTVSEKLKGGKNLSKVGGRTYLSSLSNEVPVSAHILKYAQILKETFIKRQMVGLGAKLGEWAFDDGMGLDDVLDKAEQAVFSLSQKNVKKSFVPVKDALAESFDRLDEIHKDTGGLRGVPTGFTDLDSALAGMQASNMIVLAARPGMGKTSLATNIAQHVAVVKKWPVGYFSLEMSNLEMVDRMLVAQANIDAWKMKTGNLSGDDFTKLSEAMGVLAEAPLHIDDTPGQTILEMRTKARRLHSQVGLKLIVVDYLQLVVGGGRYDSRVQEVAIISQGLKNLARELKIPVLALSQLNRAVETRGEKIPQLADLRESGSIEQDSDVVMFLYKQDEESMENFKLSISKHRNGPMRTGDMAIDLRFEGNRIKFHGMSKRQG
jgi:replicative DNA helicase